MTAAPPGRAQRARTRDLRRLARWPWVKAFGATVFGYGVLLATACDTAPRAAPRAGPSARAAITASSSAEPSPVAPSSFADRIAASSPLRPRPVAVELAGVKLGVSWCEIEGHSFFEPRVRDVFRAVGVSGARLFTLDGHHRVRRFIVAPGDGCTLKSDAAFGFTQTLAAGAVDQLYDGGRGRLVAANVAGSSFFFADDELLFQCATSARLAFAPSGEWAVAAGPGSRLGALVIGPGGCERTDWPAAASARVARVLSTPTAVAVVGDLVLIAGEAAQKVDGRQVRLVVATDRLGNEKFRFGNTSAIAGPDVFGRVVAMAPCRQGICVLDAHLRQLSVWTTRGRFVSACKLDKLFGLPYPWVADFAVSTSAAYFVISQQRGHSGVAEGNIFRVKGL